MDRRGFIVLETAVVYIVTSLAIVSLAAVFILTVKAGPTLEQTLVGAHLARELMEEVQVRKWDPSLPTNRPSYPAYSQTAIPTGPPANKASVTDIGTFNGWTESPPQDPAGNALTGFTGWQRTVTVAYVSTTTLASSGTPTAYKLVTVCATYTKTSLSTCLEWVATQ